MTDSSSLLAKIPKKNIKLSRSLGNPHESFDLTKNPAFIGLARHWQTKTDKNSPNIYEDIDNNSVRMTARE